MKKKELLDALKTDFQSAKNQRSIIDEAIQRWRREYNGEPYGNEVDGKSSIVSRDIKKQSEWQHASIIDPFVGMSDIIKADPVTYEDKPAAVQSELILNTQFCRQFDRYNFMTKAVKLLDMEGTVIVQTGWDYKEEEEEVEVPNIVMDEYGREYIDGTTKDTRIKVVRNRPTAVVCRHEDVFVDPTCQDNMDNCQFVIYRYETDMSTLKQDGRYKNLDKIEIDSNEISDDDYVSPDGTSFKYQDNPRKKLVVHEYWGNYDVDGDGIAEPIVCSWIGNTIIRLQSNPFPDKKPPFLVVPFNSVPFQLYGESNAELISVNQKIKTAIIRGFIDNMAQSNNGQKGVRKGALDPVNKARFFNGENYEYNSSGGKDFHDGSYNQIPSSAFDVLSLMNNEIESITGVKGFSGGINTGSLGAGSATAAKGALDAASVRRMNVVRNIAENLVKPLMRKWMSYNSEFLTDKEVMRITNNEFITINKDDLSGRIDIDIQVATAEDNQAKADALSFELQTGASSMDPEEVRMIRAEIARLKKMPEFAKRIETFRPEPDQLEQQIKQLEIQKLQAEIAKIQSETGENDSDKIEALSKAKLIDAQTAKLRAETDKIDLDFVAADQAGGEVDRHKRDMEKEALKVKVAEINAAYKHDLEVKKAENKAKIDALLAQNKHLMDMQKEEYKKNANLEQMAIQAKLGDKNIGVTS